jgi:APA family basic amino acid/polyamine antiporter
VLGAEGLAATTTPAFEIARRAIGSVGGTFVALAVSLSTLGFLSNQVLTSPRIYYAMARDGTFFSSVARVDPKTRAPIVAIVLQGAAAIVIAAWGRYEQILNYVVAMDFVFFALAGLALARLPKPSDERGGGVPGHPWTTGFFVLASVAVVVESLVAAPRDTAIGFVILGSAVPIYFVWRRWRGQGPSPATS